MLKIYGSMLCPDCVECCEALDRVKADYEFLDFGRDLKNLKEFLKLRDNLGLFDEARKEGYIGIPCIVKADGSVTLSWEEFM